MICLYIKTHNQTGLKYFGKTIQDPYTYKGSGTWWKSHIKKHGYDVTTEVYKQFDESEIELCREEALRFSIDNNITESVEWANLKHETLDGGFDHINCLPIETRRKYIKDWWNSLDEDVKCKINAKKVNLGERNGMYGVHRYGEDNPMYGKKHSEESLKRMSDVKKNRVVVKDAVTGEIIGAVQIDDPRYLSGQLVPIPKGTQRTAEFKQNRSEQYKKKGIKPPSSKGLLWWNDGINQIRSAEHPGFGFVRGRLSKRDK